VVQCIRHFKKACNPVRREVICNIVIEFGVHMKLVRLIKVRLNETTSQVLIGKNLPDAFPIQSGLRKHFVTIAFQICFKMCHQEGPGNSGGIGIHCNTVRISMY